MISQNVCVNALMTSHETILLLDLILEAITLKREASLKHPLLYKINLMSDTSVSAGLSVLFKPKSNEMNVYVQFKRLNITEINV